MKINSTANTANFKGIYNNKAVLKGLETISEHGTTFSALTTLAMASGVRPIAIKLTPNVKKENKEYAITNSITSGLIKFLMAEAIAIPVENAVKQIDKTPEKFLNKKAIKMLQGNAQNLVDSKKYKFATQVLKMGSGLISAIPKAMLTVSLIPVVMNLLFKKKEQKKTDSQIYKAYNPVFSNDFDKYTPSFKGSLTNKTAKGLGAILNTNSAQKFVKRFNAKDSDVARNISMATDILLTASFVHRTIKNDKIEKERKKPLIYNNLISTGISLTLGYAIDNIVKNNTQKFIDKFSKINKNDPKLPKYIEGINILRPTLIFAAIYYGILPMFSTFIADKLSENKTANIKDK